MVGDERISEVREAAFAGWPADAAVEGVGSVVVTVGPVAGGSAEARS